MIPAALLLLQAAPQLELLEPGAARGPVSGIYPHLASFNGSNECGTGALVPWAGKLWWTTYAPHAPQGSDDRLYAMDEGRDLFVFSGSIGGTPANRLIHDESRQLFMGPYVIGADGTVRTVPYAAMPGRPTATARHLTDPAGRVYTATMEEGLYEVDVLTLEVTRLFADTNGAGEGPRMGLPGYHGKGLYSGQGSLVYANNGEYGQAARTDPTTPSGVLASWDGEGPWEVVLRSQFTEVTGPGGIHGNRNPDGDPLWSIGWDHRSLILMLKSARDGGRWHRFRLPKASHSYDGAHGWNTEWPRIRDVGEGDLLMTMHGTFWSFPRAFDLGHTAGIRPRSSYLKVVGDVARWGPRVVLGCDDAARSEFLNRRRAKGTIAGPAVSQSNLWFLHPEELDRLGPAVGHGAVFADEVVEAGQWSDPFLFAGYDLRGVHLVNGGREPVEFLLDVDEGDGRFEPLRRVAVGPGAARFESFAGDEPGTWVRVGVDRTTRATVQFELRAPDLRTAEASRRTFGNLPRAGEPLLGGLVRAGDAATGLQLLATAVDADGATETVGYHELSPDLVLRRVDEGEGERSAPWMAENLALPTGVCGLDAASAYHVDDAGRRWRFPVGAPIYRDRPELLDLQRTSREVTTERDLFQCAGTFFELPAENAGGFARMRPIATHDGFVQDYCSWRGLLVLTGVKVVDGPRKGSGHVVEAGRAAVWLGAVDDLWDLGKPRGEGGPWARTPVAPGVPSDPYLMCGYDAKSVALSHDAAEPVRMGLEVDITGGGLWVPCGSWDVPAGETVEHSFPAAFAAYWVRARANRPCHATAWFRYE